MPQLEQNSEQSKRVTRVQSGASSASPFRSLFAKLGEHPQYKITAIVVALILWGYQIFAGADIMVERTIQNVAVNILGQENLRSSGYTVSNDFTASPITATIKVKAPWQNISYITGTEYALRVNLANLRHENGSQDIEIIYSLVDSTYGEIIDVSPAYINVNVEQYTNSGSIAVTPIVKGSADSALWYDVNQISVNPATVVVSGPASLVDQVRRAEVVIQTADLSEERPRDVKSAPIALYDEFGEQIVSTQLRISSNSVTIRSAQVTLSVYPTKTVPVDTTMTVTGEPARGYVLRSVSIMPRVVTIAGPRDVIDRITTIFTETSHSVSGKTAGGIMEGLMLRKPPELVYLSQTQVVLTALVEAGLRESTFKNLPIEVEGLDAGLSAVIQPSSLNVTISGNYFDMESLDESGVTLYVNAEGLSYGEHTLEVNCRVNNVRAMTYILTQPKVLVSISVE